MEIQGLSGAQNIQAQHGAPHGTALSPLGSSGQTAPCRGSSSGPGRSGGLGGAHRTHRDDDHHNTTIRPGTELRTEHGGGGEALLSACGPQPAGGRDRPHGGDPSSGNKGLDVRGENGLLPRNNTVRGGWKHVVDGGDMAASPFFSGGEEEQQQRRLRLQSAALRQRAGGRSPGSLSGDLTGAGSLSGDLTGAGSLSGDLTGAGSLAGSPLPPRPPEELRVVQEDGATERRVTGEYPQRNSLHSDRNVTRRPAGCAGSVSLQDQPAYHNRHDVIDVIDDQLCIERIDDKLLGSLISDNTAGETMDTSDLLPEPSGLHDAPPVNQTFSGTITINNQSIIVTIEDGVLTLAAPPEGYVHTDDDMVGLKEHLGMKDHEDIVLLNYDSGTKSIGKISTLASSSSSPPEPRGADPELALGDDSPPLDSSCTIIKQEVGTLCAITESDLVTPCSRNINPLGRDSNYDPQSAHSGRSKRETAVSFGCPQPGCVSFFDTRQKLKVHLLNHAKNPRPYRCSVEGCGWAFATSYKLKRHLQSHDKQRPHTCQAEGCGRRFTTVYNLKAHVKVHEQEKAFVCQVCSERFRSATRLTNHQRAHFEPQRPHKCDFPGCEKTFITFSALFSHNRTHFREVGHFTCSYPGCNKMYDKACRLKIHLRSHTGERPFLCDAEGCGWSFTSMSKLLRHKRKHEDDRRFTCPEEGCGKSFTRAEHLKGHSITHLGTKPFQCHAEGCNAKFSARSSLYIHSKKHKQDPLRNRCPMANCSKHFSSRSSLKSHMVKHHHLTADVLTQMEATPTLTPSSELVSSTATTVSGPCVPGNDRLSNLDLSSLFSGGPAPPSAIGVGVPSVGGGPAGAFSAADFSPGTVGHAQATLNLDHVRSVPPEALGTPAALGMRAAAASLGLSHPLVSSSGPFTVDRPADLLAPSPSKVVEAGGQGGAGPLLGGVELGPQEAGGKGLSHSFLESGGSARTDYRAIQLAKKKKQRGPAACSTTSAQRKSKAGKAGSASAPLAASSGRYGDGAATASGGLTLRDPVTGAQYVQIQLLQDDPPSDGDLAFQLSSQPSGSHAQLTVDLPVNILQESSVMPEDDNGSDTSQFTGSTINLQDLE
ncbi:hypothetical protein NHX12_030148 [Muraenolepis orangiensis]|uniref:Transcription factor IIIA n=1 Tax=Muraenolepis orangiensis TaxID=630683 RepID=A0A9Q0E9K8_9TELE|nr:hypothetical protein NHX12_030148 [Muraenolepis orangiensis]